MASDTKADHEQLRVSLRRLVELAEREYEAAEQEDREDRLQHYDHWRLLCGALQRLEELEAQLPEGMKHCTIEFRECEKGHGRLTATNWVDNGCPYCRVTELEAIEAHYESLVRQNADLLTTSAKWAREVGALRLENQRLRKGDFTSEELQELCHNLSESDYKAFCDGCDEYQRRLFGKCRAEELVNKQTGMDSNPTEITGG